MSTDPIRVKSVPPDGSDPAWSPDGTRIAFSAARGLSIMNADGSGERVLVADSAGIESFMGDWLPDGQQIVFSRCSGRCSRLDGAHRIFIADATTGAVRQLIADAVAPVRATYGDSAPAWAR